MGIRFNTNVSSISFLRHRFTDIAASKKLKEDISSPSRINGTGDDAPSGPLRMKELSKQPLNDSPLLDSSLALFILDGIETPQKRIASIRSNFGTLHDRHETSIKNLNMTTGNSPEVNSGIRDADVAEQTSRLTSSQIQQQAGVSVLAASNLTTGIAALLLDE
jgi:hypothetical protein